jgi:hypothetical protein
VKLAIMQPYFLPYLGYFSLIKYVDKFILLDNVQFIRHGWIERNRILKPSEGWQYFRVPLLRHHREVPIKDIRIDNGQAWKKQIIDQLQPYKKLAPYFPKVIALLTDAFSQEFEGVADLNKVTLEAVCNYLGIRTPIAMFSELKLAIEPVYAPDEWALNICKAMTGVTEYWNPPGGIAFFDRSKYEANQVQLKFQRVGRGEYDQGRATFEPGLSIIDVMMFNSVEQINTMLDDYELF